MTAIFFITTYQFPHLEHFTDDVEALALHTDTLVIDLVPSLPFRTDRVFTNPFEYLSRLCHNSSITPRVRSLLFRMNSVSRIQQPQISSLPHLAEIDFTEIYRTIKGFYIVQTNNTEPPASLIEKLSLKLLPYFARLKAYLNNLSLSLNPKSIHIFNGRLPVESIISASFPSSQYVWYECNQANFGVIRLFHPIHDLRSYGCFEVPRLLQLIPAELLISTFQEYIIEKIGQPLQYDLSASVGITYYTSSNDEYSAWYDEPICQHSIISRFVLFASETSTVSIRVHPNTSTKSKSNILYWQFLATSLSLIPGLRWYSFSSQQSSYSLAAESSATYSIGSSIGSELLFSGMLHTFIGDQHQYGSIPGIQTITEASFLEFGPAELSVTPPPTHDSFRASLAAAFFCTTDKLLADYSTVSTYHRPGYIKLPPSLLRLEKFLLENKLCLTNSLQDLLDIHLP